MTRRQVAILDCLPPSTNNLHATARRGPKKYRHKTAEYKAWIDYALDQIKKQLAPVATYPVEVTIWVIGGEGFNERRDVANVEKPLTDLIVRAKVLKDDNVRYVWDSCQRFRPAIEKGERACVIITLIEGIDADWRREALGA